MDDANFAGGKKKLDCALILTEGNSAKTGVISGLQKKSRDYVGVFPLRGKCLNVQKATKA